ncbi:uncharacterized protein BYT42DRAFT_607876 [Radiomyces spectabilis]|uniref:uncharacterized protein n=1 Tax=Radiomyces spectabilis TaxID=64574 RepID=UPI00221E8569|nr:uncharacterized protein BYT42DRAFT_607876 [Radiomyces spectabilis]KAI8369481.1 hypothetical protein BYT42DRAFT_607876 [Radiomyces spectabilis]
MNKRKQSDDACPLCSSSLQEYRIAIDSTFTMCENTECVYPFEQQSLDPFINDRSKTKSSVDVHDQSPESEQQRGKDRPSATSTTPTHLNRPGSTGSKPPIAVSLIDPTQPISQTNNVNAVSAKKRNLNDTEVKQHSESSDASSVTADPEKRRSRNNTKAVKKDTADKQPSPSPRSGITVHNTSTWNTNPSLGAKSNAKPITLCLPPLSTATVKQAPAAPTAAESTSSSCSQSQSQSQVASPVSSAENDPTTPPYMPFITTKSWDTPPSVGVRSITDILWNDNEMIPSYTAPTPVHIATSSITNQSVERSPVTSEQCTDENLTDFSWLDNLHDNLNTNIM